MSHSESDSSVSSSDGEIDDMGETQDDGACTCGSCSSTMPYDEGKPVCCAKIVDGRIKDEMCQKGMIKQAQLSWISVLDIRIIPSLFHRRVAIDPAISLAHLLAYSLALAI